MVFDKWYLIKVLDKWYLIKSVSAVTNYNSSSCLILRTYYEGLTFKTVKSCLRNSTNVENNE